MFNIVLCMHSILKNKKHLGEDDPVWLNNEVDTRIQTGTNPNFQTTILTVKYLIKFNNAREARYNFYRVKFCSLRGHLIMKGLLIINGPRSA